MVPDAAGKFVLVGAVSFGVGCAFPTQYGVYSEVAGSTLRPWVEARLSELSSAGPAPPGGGTGTGSGGSSGGGQTGAPGGGGGQTGAPAGGGGQTSSPVAGGQVGADEDRPGAAPEGARPVTRLTVSRRLGSAARARRARRLSVVLETTEPVRGVRASLTQRSRTVAQGRLSKLVKVGRIRLRVGRGLRAGSAVLNLTARDGDGRRTRVVRRVRLSR